jgi:hypothetical protein
MNLPVLDIDEFNKKISLKGTSNSVVLVNNIRRNRDYLQLIRPENIERVEVSYSPGARYWIKNIDGIINIVTKSLVTGYNGYMRGDINSLLEYGSLGGGYTYATDKMAASFSVSDFYFEDKQRDISLFREVRNGFQTTRTEKKSNGYYSFYHSPNLSVNMDYTLSPKTFITFSSGYSDSPSRAKTTYTGNISSGNETRDFEAVEKEKENYGTYNASLYFQTDFNEKRSMNIETNYYSTNSTRDIDYNEFNNTASFYANRQWNHGLQRSLETQINFQQKMLKMEWEEGARVSWQENRSETEMNESLNTQRQKELRTVFYVNVLGDIGGKMAYQLSNIFDVVKIFDNRNVAHTNSGFTPRLMLRYFITGKQNITFNYTVSHPRPSFSILDPTPVYVDSSRIITGNPALSPYFRHGFRLTYQITQPEKRNLFFRISFLHQIMNGAITQKEYLDDMGVYHISYSNADRRSGTQMQINSSIDLFDWWKINLDGNIHYQNYRDGNQGQFNKELWIYNLSWGSIIRYKNLTCNYAHNPSFRTATLTGYERYEGWSSISLRYRLNSSWIFSLMLREFTPKIYQRETYDTDFTEIYRNEMTERTGQLNIGIQYYFQKGKQRRDKQKNTKQFEGNVGGTSRTY